VNKASEKQSFSLRNLNPNNAVKNLKVKLKRAEAKQLIKPYNIREAIQKNDLARIRLGSPGSRNGNTKDNKKKED